MGIMDRLKRYIKNEDDKGQYKNKNPEERN